MRTPVEMPRFGPDEVDGRINAWLKEVGDSVQRGEPIAEIETDKAIMELESLSSGTLVEIIRQVDEVVPIGEVIAYLETD